MSTTPIGDHALMMPIVGFIDPRHPRMLATLDAIEHGLGDQPGGAVAAATLRQPEASATP